MCTLDDGVATPTLEDIGVLPVDGNSAVGSGRHTDTLATEVGVCGSVYVPRDGGLGALGCGAAQCKLIGGGALAAAAMARRAGGGGNAQPPCMPRDDVGTVGGKAPAPAPAPPPAPVGPAPFLKCKRWRGTRPGWAKGGTVRRLAEAGVYKGRP